MIAVERLYPGDVCRDGEHLCLRLDTPEGVRLPGVLVALPDGSTRVLPPSHLVRPEEPSAWHGEALCRAYPPSAPPSPPAPVPGALLGLWEGIEKKIDGG